MTLSFWVLILIPLVASSNLDVETTEEGFTVTLNGIEILEHTEEQPILFVGDGRTVLNEFRGNFHINDEVISRIPLKKFSVTPFTAENKWQIVLQETGSSNYYQSIIELTAEEGRPVSMVVTPQSQFPIDRLWIRVKAEANEAVFGGGEQFSYLNLRGHDYPIWTREQGVGRNQSTITTFFAHQREGAGGAYHTTYFPQPTFISSRHFFCHVNETNYITLDFKHTQYHEIEVHSNQDGKVQLLFDSGESIQDTVSKVSGMLGRQPPLPNWVYSGAILGVQGGTDKMLGYLRQAQQSGVKVSGLWIQDWVGKKVTSFGSRLYWNWVWDQKWYPNLDKVIKELKAEGVRVFGYINPHIITTGSLFTEADQKGYFIKDRTGKTYEQDFGEYDCGTVDFTNPEAFEWYKDVIKTNMIDLGLEGWMADFSEYTPVDAVFHSGISGKEAHNLFPVLWAECNRAAVVEAGKQSDILYWMRAGFSGTGKYASVMWAGDQNVDFSYSDGLPSAITAALSMGMSGMGLTHFDIGGYTTFPPMVRTPELFLRSAEAAVFTPIFRTHEGNMPQVNWQFYSTPGTQCRFARLSQIYATLGPYIKEAVQNNSDYGIPVQRPLFFAYEEDTRTLDIQYEYMFGDDLLVSPVHQPLMSEWNVYLPKDEWIYMWDAKQYQGPIDVTVNVPYGEPPVFYRKTTRWTELFGKLAEIKVKETCIENVPPHVPLDQKIVQLVMSQVAKQTNEPVSKDEL